MRIDAARQVEHALWRCRDWCPKPDYEHSYFGWLSIAVADDSSGSLIRFETARQIKPGVKVNDSPMALRKSAGARVASTTVHKFPDVGVSTPYCAPPRATNLKGMPLQNRLGQAHILVVEDNEDDRVLIRRILRKARLRLSVVNDGEEAIEYLSGIGQYGDRKRHPLPMLLLLDLKMPGMNGFELLGWIRRQPQLKNLRVVVMTASNEIKDATEAYRLGANSFLVKPLELESAQLFATLKANGITILDTRPAVCSPAVA